MDKQAERLLTVKEVAILLSIDKSTVYKWADQKRLSYIDLSKENAGKRCLRFRREDLHKLIKEKLVRSN